MKDIVKYSLGILALAADTAASFYAGEYRQESFDVVITTSLINTLNRIERACTKTPELPAKQAAPPQQIQYPVQASQ